MPDALTEFGYQAGTMVQSAMNGAVAPLSIQLDSVLTLLRASANPSTPSTRATLPTSATITRLQALAGRKQRVGMSRETGRALTGLPHLRQSVNDIIYTRLKSRVKRRKYGCNLAERLDYPQNDYQKALLIADIAQALDQWEPRFKLAQVKLTASTDAQYQGQLVFALNGNFLGEEVSVEVAA